MGRAAGMWMNGSTLKSERPASSTRTDVPGSALRRLARAQPALPPPTITKSYVPSVTPARSLRLPAEPALWLRPGVVPDVLGLAVLLQPRLAELATDAGLLVAAPLGLRDV